MWRGRQKQQEQSEKTDNTKIKIKQKTKTKQTSGMLPNNINLKEQTMWSTAKMLNVNSEKTRKITRSPPSFFNRVHALG